MPEPTLAAAEARLRQIATDPLICNLGDDIRRAAAAVLAEYDRRGEVDQRARLVADYAITEERRQVARFIAGDEPDVEPAPPAGAEPMPETAEAFMRRFYSPDLIGPADAH